MTNNAYLIWFSLVWIIILYFFNALIGHRLPSIEPKKLFVYVAGVALLGVLGEITIDSIYKLAFGSPFWLYRILPAHHAFTSFYSPVLWGMFGFYLYIFHGTLSKLRPAIKDWQLACIFAFEAVLLEIAFNLSHILVTGDYVFYYLPADLWHLTSLIALPFYFVGGYVIVLTMKRFLKDPIFFGILSSVGILTLLFFTN